VVSQTDVRSFGRSDFSDIRWGARSGREDARRAIVDHFSPCLSLEGYPPSG